MTDQQVLAVLAALRQAGVRAWVAGGWGVDALVGEQTRPHDDLDLAVDAEHEATAIAALTRLGYVLAEDERPVRFVLRAAAAAVDVHPVAFDGTGAGVQAGPAGTSFPYPADGFGWGRIGREAVPCLTAAQQLRFHLGYPPDEKDDHDVALLRDWLGLLVPPSYRGRPA